METPTQDKKTFLTREQVDAATHKMEAALYLALLTEVKIEKIQEHRDAFSLRFSCNADFGIFQFTMNKVTVRIDLWKQIDGDYAYGRVGLSWEHPDGGTNGHDAYFPGNGCRMLLELDPSTNKTKIISS